MEPLIKILLRCRQYYESKYEIVRILVKAKQRENFLNRFEEELDHIDSNLAKNYYQQLLKDSMLLYGKIDRLRGENPMLNRPFYFNSKNLQKTMIKQIVNIRRNLRQRFPLLKAKNELDEVLDKNGKIVKVSELEEQNRSTSTKKSKATRFIDLNQI
jgi:hypothetical protein